MTEPRPSVGFAGAAVRIGTSMVIARGLSVLLAVGLARLLGPAGLGMFLGLMAAAEVVGLLGDLGVATNVSRIAATQGDPESRSLLGDALRLRFALTIPAGLILVAYVFATRGGGYVPAAAVLALYVFMNGAMVTVRQWTIGRQKHGLAGRSIVVSQATLVLVALGSAAAGFGLMGLVCAELVSATVGFGYLVTLQRGTLLGPRDAGLPRAAGGARVSRLVWLLRESLPLGAAGILASVYSRFDVALVSLLAGDTEAGVYGAALQPYLAVAGFASVIFMVAVPHVARLRSDGMVSETGPWKAATLTQFAGWISGGLLFALSGVGVRILYGEGFASAAPLVRGLSLAVPAVFFSNVLMGRAVAEKRMGLVLGIGVVGVMGTIALDVALVPRIGASGAVVSTVVVETLIACWLAKGILRSLVKGFVVTWGSGLAIATAIVLCQVALGWPQWVLLPVPLVCALLLYRLRGSAS